MSNLFDFRSDVDDSQHRDNAMRPDTSVWVAASAGAGKTTVLTNRVLSLLVHGTPPARILCLTFTKAAAAEMAIRINQKLGIWATLPDGELTEQLRALIGSWPSASQRRRARGLFGAVLDVPGGMKIQTIHAFCQSLLRRFPLEAGIAPHFEVMEERRAAEMMLAAREEVLLMARRAEERGDDRSRRLADALATVTSAIQEEGFNTLMTDVAGERARLRALLHAHGGLDGVSAAIREKLGLRGDEDEAGLCAQGMTDAAMDIAGLRAAVARLATGTDGDQKRGVLLQSFLDDMERRVAQFAEYCGIFHTKDGEPRKTLITKKAANGSSAAEVLAAEADRLVKLCKKLKAVRIANLSIATVVLGDALLSAYEAHKSRHAMLDYDDLILGARDLLRGSGAASWVLFKLDGGLDHILVDEAQDTSPEQWEVIAALAEEFFAGSGAREQSRTIFAVGDVKQSIYSFQRADPEAFHRMRAHFRNAVSAAASKWADQDLLRSFRSTAAVLSAVDGVFSKPTAMDGVADAGHPIEHYVQRIGQAGLVELWPPVVPEPPEPPAPWAPPVAAVPGDSPAARLAAVIAANIRQWLDSGDRLASRDRAVRPGDIMVLVRRRSAFVDELVRCLKARNVPVAGVDRMVLTEQIAVMDLMAFGQFLLLPEDNLTLASVLKSPLVGLDEETLFTLAYGRGELTLWNSLKRAAERSDAPEAVRAAHELLARYLSIADYLSPYDLFSEILSRDGGRRRFLSRLGLEADDPISEFMSLALTYERQAPPSLQGFLHWLISGQAEIKRDLEQGVRDEVRIMTVHGAKGLQAPIVILPDDMQLPYSLPRLLWAKDDEDDAAAHLPLWLMRAAEREAVTDVECANVQRKRDQEYRRLLYVALTRAEDRLYVCGWRGKREPSPDCWYRLVHEGLSGGLAEPASFDFTAIAGEAGWLGQGLRFVSPQIAEPDGATKAVIGAGPVAPSPLPDWACKAAPDEPKPTRPLAPSRPDPASESEPALVSPLATSFGDTSRFQRGLVIHRLLQTLPDLPTDTRIAASRRYLARPALALAEAAQAEIAAEVERILSDDRFAPLFGPDSRAEVPITGALDDGFVISGQIDRLVVLPDRVLVVDYKSNRPPPQRVADVPVLYLRQLAAYRALLRGVYPGRAVTCALLWTDGPLWMEMPEELLDQQRVGHGRETAP